MKKKLNLFTATLVCLVFNQTIVVASSHREAPLIAYDPLADNTDVYAFKSPCDTNNIVLIANYIPFELPQGGPNYYNFGPNIRYEIHVDNNSSTTGDDIVYRFTFQQVNKDSTTFFNIRLGQQNIKTTYVLERSIDGGLTFVPVITNGVVPPNNIGPRSIENTITGLGALNYDSVMLTGISTATTGERVFAGPVDDPFFVDLGGAFDIGNFRTTGRDGLAKFNVHSLVIEVPVSTLQKTGKTSSQATNILDPAFVIGVYATADRMAITTLDSTGGQPSVSGGWVQVSRLGMPLTNEVIIPVGEKDNWNAAPTNNEFGFAQYFENPELALYMDDSKFGPAVPGLSALRIQSNSLAAFDFRNGRQGLFPLKGTTAVTGSALDDAIFGTILLPDNSSPRAVDILPIFLMGVPNLRPYQLDIGKGGNPLAAGKPFINNFLPTFGDMLRLNMAVPVTPRNDPKFSSLGLVQAAVLGLTDPAYNGSAALQFIPNMDGFPNGRRLEDDVTTIELQAVSGIVLAAIGLWYDDFSGGNPVTPDLLSVLGFNAGVTSNDTTFKDCFPFVQSPWRGFNGTQYIGPKSFQALPVTFLSFTAEKRGQKVQLNWQVTNEINNDHYEVEQSVGSANFKNIGKIISRHGSGINNYELTDINPSLDKVNFYRIKQVDKDGRFSYSPVRMIKFSPNHILTISPNPAKDYIKIYSSQGDVNVEIFDASGHKMISRKLMIGDNRLDISRFTKGVYTIVADKNGSRLETSKILKQ